MNKLSKLLVGVVALTAASAFAQGSTSGYLQDARGGIAGSGAGLCWRTNFWTPADAVKGCDNAYIKAAAPVVVDAPKPAAAVAAPAPAPAPAKPPPPVSEKVSFAADTFFDSGKAVLKKEGTAKLDDVVGLLKGVNLEAVIAVGHTDDVGSDAYNQALSVRRAESVKTYLVSKGIAMDRIYVEGKGEAVPVEDNKSSAGRAKNRRVEIEVVGTRVKK